MKPEDIKPNTILNCYNDDSMEKSDPSSSLEEENVKEMLSGMTEADKETLLSQCRHLNEVVHKGFDRAAYLEHEINGVYEQLEEYKVLLKDSNKKTEELQKENEKYKQGLMSGLIEAREREILKQSEDKDDRIKALESHNTQLQHQSQELEVEKTVLREKYTNAAQKVIDLSNDMQSGDMKQRKLEATIAKLTSERDLEKEKRTKLEQERPNEKTARMVLKALSYAEYFALARFIDPVQINGFIKFRENCYNSLKTGESSSTETDEFERQIRNLLGEHVPKVDDVFFTESPILPSQKLGSPSRRNKHSSSKVATDGDLKMPQKISKSGKHLQNRKKGMNNGMEALRPQDFPIRKRKRENSQLSDCDDFDNNDGVLDGSVDHARLDGIFAFSRKLSGQKFSPLRSNYAIETEKETKGTKKLLGKSGDEVDVTCRKSVKPSKMKFFKEKNVQEVFAEVPGTVGNEQKNVIVCDPSTESMEQSKISSKKDIIPSVVLGVEDSHIELDEGLSVVPEGKLIHSSEVRRKVGVSSSTDNRKDAFSTQNVDTGKYRKLRDVGDEIKREKLPNAPENDAVGRGSGSVKVEWLETAEREGILSATSRHGGESDLYSDRNQNAKDGNSVGESPSLEKEASSSNPRESRYEAEIIYESTESMSMKLMISDPSDDIGKESSEPDDEDVTDELKIDLGNSEGEQQDENVNEKSNIGLTQDVVKSEALVELNIGPEIEISGYEEPVGKFISRKDRKKKINRGDDESTSFIPEKIKQIWQPAEVITSLTGKRSGRDDGLDRGGKKQKRTNERQRRGRVKYEEQPGVRVTTRTAKGVRIDKNFVNTILDKVLNRNLNKGQEVEKLHAAFKFPEKTVIDMAEYIVGFVMEEMGGVDMSSYFHPGRKSDIIASEKEKSLYEFIDEMSGKEEWRDIWFCMIDPLSLEFSKLNKRTDRNRFCTWVRIFSKLCSITDQIPPFRELMKSVIRRGDRQTVIEAIQYMALSWPSVFKDLWVDECFSQYTLVFSLMVSRCENREKLKRSLMDKSQVDVLDCDQDKTLREFMTRARISTPVKVEWNPAMRNVQVSLCSDFRESLLLAGLAFEQTDEPARGPLLANLANDVSAIFSQWQNRSIPLGAVLEAIPSAMVLSRFLIQGGTSKSLTPLEEGCFNNFLKDLDFGIKEVPIDNEFSCDFAGLKICYALLDCMFKLCVFGPRRSKAMLEELEKCLFGLKAGLLKKIRKDFEKPS